MTREGIEWVERPHVKTAVVPLWGSPDQVIQRLQQSVESLLSQDPIGVPFHRAYMVTKVFVPRLSDDEYPSLLVTAIGTKLVQVHKVNGEPVNEATPAARGPIAGERLWAGDAVGLAADGKLYGWKD